MVCFPFNATFALKPEISIPDIDTAVGIDMGVKRFFTLSDGNFINNLEEKLKPLENKIALLQRRIKHKVKGSNNIKKAYLKLVLLHKRKSRHQERFSASSLNLTRQKPRHDSD